MCEKLLMTKANGHLPQLHKGLIPSVYLNFNERARLYPPFDHKVEALDIMQSISIQLPLRATGMQDLLTGQYPRLKKLPVSEHNS